MRGACFAGTLAKPMNRQNAVTDQLHPPLSPQESMKPITLIVLLCAAVLAGCASNRSPGSAPAATAQTETKSPQMQAVSIPAASAKKMVLFMSGSKTATEAKDWAAFKQEWRATFADHAKSAGVAFSMQDGAPRTMPDAGTALAIYVNDYRMVGIGSRIFFGVMTGNAYIDTKLTYVDLKTGKTFGSQAFNTSSSAWDGVFGKMTPQQVDTIATEVFRQINAAR